MVCLTGTVSTQQYLASCWYYYLFGENDFCRTPLHFAIVRGHTEVVETLLEWKAAVNAEDNDGKTPLLKVSSAYAHLVFDCFSCYWIITAWRYASTVYAVIMCHCVCVCVCVCHTPVLYQNG